MKVIHYIPEVTKHDIVSDELLNIVNVMRDMADVQLIVGNDGTRNLFKEEKPDIIHVHSCWDFHASRLIEEAHDKGVAAIISTHGGFLPYTLKHEQPMGKRAKMLTYQTSCIKEADAVLLSNKEERDNIINLRLQRNTEIIPSSILNSLVSTQDVVKTLLRIYQKVIDTRYRLSLGNEERDVLRRLLHIGCSQPNFILKTSNITAGNYDSLSREQWKRILLYAHDEHIEDIIEIGCRYDKVTIPDIQASKILRFKAKIEKDDGIEYVRELSKKKSSLKHRIEQQTSHEEKTLRDIVYLTAVINARFKDKTVSMRHLATMFKLLQGGDYDEDKLSELLASVSLKRPMQRILFVLQEDLKLTEGFLPLEPIGDGKTQDLRKIINMC